jgi:hypothetical protein
MTTINSSKARVSTAIIITLPWYKHEVGNLSLSTSSLYQGNVIMIAVLTLALLLLIIVIAYFMFVSR